jgi:hypothetical protein
MHAVLPDGMCTFCSEHFYCMLKFLYSWRDATHQACGEPAGHLTFSTGWGIRTGVWRRDWDWADSRRLLDVIHLELSPSPRGEGRGGGLHTFPVFPPAKIYQNKVDSDEAGPGRRSLGHWGTLPNYKALLFIIRRWEWAPLGGGPRSGDSAGSGPGRSSRLIHGLRPGSKIGVASRRTAPAHSPPVPPSRTGVT